MPRFVLHFSLFVSVVLQALQEQAAKYHKLEQKHAEVNCKYEESCKKNDHAKKLNAELLRRCEDTSRAYDQERKESIKCKALCDSLHESVKVSLPSCPSHSSSLL